MIGRAAIAYSLLASTTLLAASTEVDGEITKITKKRTGFTIDLTGDLALDQGAKVSLTVDGKKRTGTVTKVTDNGKAFIKLNKGLPKAVDEGDRVSMTVDSGALASADDKAGAVQLSKGGYSKAYWNEVSYLAAHRNPGVRADVELSYLSAGGNEKSKGGRIEDDTEYKVTDKHTNFSGDVGFVGRGGIGGGALLSFDNSEYVSSASIDTEDTATTDSDENKATRKVTQLKPYVQFQSRAKTGDVGFGVGLGVPIRSTTAGHDITIASEQDKEPDAKTNESGVSLEGLVGSNKWAFILGLTPALSGKIKQSGEGDVDHKSSEYGLHFETYGARMKSRVGVVFFSAKDDYDGDALTEKSTRFSGRVDIGMGTINLVPGIDYTTTKRSRGDVNGTFTELDIGSRVAKAGRFAPFLSLSLNVKSGKEKTLDDRDVKSANSGLRIAGGINI